MANLSVASSGDAAARPSPGRFILAEGELLPSQSVIWGK